MCYPLISDKSFVRNRWCYSQLNISLIELVLFLPSLSSGPIVHISKISHISNKISSRIYPKDSYGSPKVFSSSFCLLCRTYIRRLLNSSTPIHQNIFYTQIVPAPIENPLKSLSKGICYSKICTSIGHYIINQLYEATAPLFLCLVSKCPRFHTLVCSSWWFTLAILWQHSHWHYLQVFEVCCGPWVQWPAQPPYPPEGPVLR